MIPGTSELIIIFAVLILLFGANKLPQLGRSVGESIKNFKKGIKPESEAGTPNLESSKKDTSF